MCVGAEWSFLKLNKEVIDLKAARQYLDAPRRGCQQIAKALNCLGSGSQTMRMIMSCTMLNTITHIVMSKIILWSGETAWLYP